MKYLVEGTEDERRVELNPAYTGEESSNYCALQSVLAVRVSESLC